MSQAIKTFIISVRLNRRLTLNKKLGPLKLSTFMIAMDNMRREGFFKLEDDWKLGYYLPEDDYLNLYIWASKRFLRGIKI